MLTNTNIGYPVCMDNEFARFFIKESWKQSRKFTKSQNVSDIAVYQLFKWYFISSSVTFLEPACSAAYRSLIVTAPSAPHPHCGHWRKVSKWPFALYFPEAKRILKSLQWFGYFWISSQESLLAPSKFELHDLEISTDCPISKYEAVWKWYHFVGIINV